MVVVVSAMSGETNRLIELAQQVDPKARGRELDVLLTTGEQVTIALLAMALEKRGYPRAPIPAARSRSPPTARTTRRASSPSITSASATTSKAGRIVVVAGFQGVDEHDNITTLGRGGSDTTGVALAAALKADECQIFTDVDGVYTTDPRVEPEGAPPRHHHLRGNAGNGQPRFQGAADSGGRICAKIQRAAARAFFLSRKAKAP